MTRNKSISAKASNKTQSHSAQVFWLGMVSFFNDLSSEVVMRVLPLYLLAVVGTSLVGVGIVEAIAEGTSVFAKMASGLFSDKISKRKPFIFAGYGLSVLSRPLILVSPTLGFISLARFLEKIGKGIRTSP